jgi:hypothetical protein
MNYYEPAFFAMGYDCAYDPSLPDAGPCVLSNESTYQGNRRPRRGAVTDQSGKLITSQNVARVGPQYTLWVTGLGQLTASSVGGSSLPSGFYGGIEIGSPSPLLGYYLELKVSYRGYSQFPGLNQINFALPKTLLSKDLDGTPQPCGDYKLEISLSFDTRVSPPYVWNHDGPTIEIPVLVKTGDVPCR